jgi:hypothetical protein
VENKNYISTILNSERQLELNGSLHRKVSVGLFPTGLNNRILLLHNGQPWVRATNPFKRKSNSQTVRVTQFLGPGLWSPGLGSRKLMLLGFLIALSALFCVGGQQGWHKEQELWSSPALISMLRNPGMTMGLSYLICRRGKMLATADLLWEFDEISE